MIAQALSNFPARAGKHLSLVIVNAHCQPRDNGCSSAIHKQKFRVSSFKFRGRKPHLALSTWHLPEARACLMFLDSCGGESTRVCQLEPARKFSCIRARLKTCRNRLNTELGFSPCRSSFCRG